MLTAFNAGDWPRARALMDDLASTRVALRNERNALENATDMRARAALYSQARSQGQERIDATIAAWEAVVAAHPGTHWDWVELGRLYRENNQIDLALPAVEQALATVVSERDRSVGLNELGDILAKMNRADEALANYEEGLAISERLAAASGAWDEPQRDLSVSLEKVGDMLAAMNRTEEALARYQESYALREHLNTVPDAPVQTQRDLSVSLSKIGKMLAATNRPEEALARFEESLAIAASLAAAPGAPAEAQRDLSVSLNKVGDMLAGMNQHQEALARFEESLGIAERLAASPGAPAQTQRDLALSLDRVGDMLAATNRPQETLASYERGLALRQRLAAMPGALAQMHRDLAVSYAKLANLEPARHTWRLVYKQFVAMERAGLLADTDRRFLDRSRQLMEQQEAWNSRKEAKPYET